LARPAPAPYSRVMPLPLGFIPPCLPTNAPQPPTRETWLHEIKHDGFRVIARKDGDRVRLYSRPGNDLTYRFPLVVETMSRLRSRSCIIDGETVACGEKGAASREGTTASGHHRRRRLGQPRPDSASSCVGGGRGAALQSPMNLLAARLASTPVAQARPPSVLIVEGRRRRLGWAQ
jgi:hypothetical protein